MPATPIKVPKRTRTRDALLVSMQKLLLDPNVHITVPQVVAGADVAQGTFYNYFTNISEGIDAVGGVLLAEHARVQAEVIKGATDQAEVIARSARQTLMLIANRPDVGRLWLTCVLPADLFMTGMRRHLRGHLKRGVAAGVFDVDNLEVAFTVHIGIQLGACLDIYRGRLPVAAIGDVVALELRALGVSPARAADLVRAPQEFAPWPALPLSIIDSD